ncbi:hypothetical protein HRbin09_01987 [bacterium HR09]|nr:hypothetical protein HRbin09_01987 [bacterium HR09]
MWRLALCLICLGVDAAAVDLTITASPARPRVGEEVTFTFSPAVSQSGDEVLFDFGDGATGRVSWGVECMLFGGCKKIKHTYLEAGSFRVLASGKVTGQDASGSLNLTVDPAPVPADLYLLAAAHVQGTNNTNWRTDLVVNNVTSGVVSYKLCLLRRGTGNQNPVCKSFTLPGRQARRHQDVLFTEFGSEGAAALRIEAAPGVVLATSRTYNALEAGTYGQFVPVLGLSQALLAGEEGRLLQLSHNPALTDGFRTNLGLLNPTPAVVTAQLRFYRGDGILIGELAQDLQPYEFTQLDKVLERVTDQPVEDFYLVVSCNPAGARLFAYASVVDNRTGDAILVPLQKVPAQQ